MVVDEDPGDLPDWLSDEECVDESDVEIEISSEDDELELPKEEEDEEEDEEFGSLEARLRGKLRAFKRKAPSAEKTYLGEPLQVEPDDHIL